MATSYDQLLTDIPAWMVNESGEFAEQLPRFIDLAELRLSRDLSTVNAFNHVTDGLTLTAGSPYLDLPADVVTIRIIRWQDPDGRWLTVEKKDLPFIMEWWPDPAETGDPRYYAYETDSRLYLAATPADSYPVQVHYRRRLPALSESNPTNWLTENAGDALLYACLIEASAFAIDQNQAQTYAALYKDAVAAVNGEATRTLRDDLRTITQVTANIGG
jgi:hypothetical protein